MPLSKNSVFQKSEFLVQPNDGSQANSENSCLLSVITTFLHIPKKVKSSGNTPEKHGNIRDKELRSISCEEVAKETSDKSKMGGTRSSKTTTIRERVASTLRASVQFQTENIRRKVSKKINRK